MKHALILAGSALALILPLRAQIRTLQPDNLPDTSFVSELNDLQMEPAHRLDLENAIKLRDYKRAETLLIQEADADPQSPRAAKALVLAAGIFFLDGQYLKCAIAWKKAEAIAPLDDRSRFTLAMAYVRLNREDWARPELEKLSTAQPQNPLYLYWLGRLDYDARNYAASITRLQRVVELDPKMMRGYETLGLCYDYLGQFEEAIRNYRRAIQLNRAEAKPSPWPNINLAISLVSVNQLAEAEQSLQEALTIDPQLPQAHYQLGRILEMHGDLRGAIAQLNQAAKLDSAYAEPHLLLGRIYHRLDEPTKADAEIARFRQLKPSQDPPLIGTKLSPQPN